MPAPQSVPDGLPPGKSSARFPCPAPQSVSDGSPVGKKQRPVSMPCPSVRARRFPRREKCIIKGLPPLSPSSPFCISIHSCASASACLSTVCNSSQIALQFALDCHSIRTVLRRNQASIARPSFSSCIYHFYASFLPPCPTVSRREKASPVFHALPLRPCPTVPPSEKSSARFPCPALQSVPDGFPVGKNVSSRGFPLSPPSRKNTKKNIR